MPVEAPRTIHPLAHIAAFQVVWFACVLGAARGMVWPALASTLPFLAWTLRSGRRPRAEAGFVLQAALLGWGLDSLLAAGGVLAFAAPAPLWPGHLAPVWIACLWASFATLTPRSLAWLLPRPLLAAFLGALAGPLTYLGAARLGAAELLRPLPLVAALVALEYALALPLLFALSRRATAPPDSAPAETDPS